MSELDGSNQQNGAHNTAEDSPKGRRESRARRLPDVETLSFEDAQAELDSVVATLEAGEIDLDRSLALYERGITLARHCQALLDSATLRVERLRASGSESGRNDGFTVETWAPSDES
jgi:exodeoxyribonuclease VII small subunit